MISPDRWRISQRLGMGSFDHDDSIRWRRATSGQRGDAEPMTLEGEIVGDRIHVAQPAPEPVWGREAGRLARRLLVIAAILAMVVILVPLMLAVIAAVAVMAIIGRLLLGRTGMTMRWMRPGGRQTR